MIDTSKKFCSIFFDVLAQKGVKNMVCSPGSRNVPLLIAASSRPSIKKYFAVDERSAAFMALGIAIVKQEPVALICTSGTALLNYAPAVAEAYYQGIPLIVVSADRPVQWIDQDDSQTLRQDDILEKFVKKSYSISDLEENSLELQWYVNRIANDAVIQSCESKPGPVHVNFHLGEPLGKKTERVPEEERTINIIEAEGIINREVIKNLAEELSKSRVLFVAGFLQPDSRLQKAVGNFILNPNVVAMAETLSNLHLDYKDYSVDSVLTAYDSKELDRLAPDIVVSIGGALVSRKLKEYLRRNRNRIRHWNIGFNHTTSDPFMSLSLKIELEPSRFFKSINPVLKRIKCNPKVATFQKEWNRKKEEAAFLKNKFVAETPWSELKAFNFILKNIPSNYNLFLSNGTAVRYSQIIPHRIPHAEYCNRGVSGIDGTLSTAIGSAMAFPGNTLLITGDLSLTYDIGALGMKNIPESFKIIVIDNQGGGIFRFIPSTSCLEEREEYLCQSPLLPLKELADGYGWKYYECESEQTLKNIMHEFFSSHKKSILKISCNGILSAEILGDYMKLKVK